MSDSFQLRAASFEPSKELERFKENDANSSSGETEKYFYLRDN